MGTLLWQCLLYFYNASCIAHFTMGASGRFVSVSGRDMTLARWDDSRIGGLYLPLWLHAVTCGSLSSFAFHHMALFRSNSPHRHTAGNKASRWRRVGKRVLDGRTDPIWLALKIEDVLAVESAERPWWYWYMLSKTFFFFSLLLQMMGQVPHPDVA